MAHANPPKSTPTNTSLREAIYFYGDLCAHFQAECEFGKASVDKRNENIRLEGD